MIHQPVLLGVALLCGFAAIVWGRSTMRQERAWRRISAMAADAAASEPEVAESEQAAADLARSSFRKELHTTVFYIVVAVMALVASFAESSAWTLPFLLVL